MVIGERLDERRKAASLSQSELARRVGVTQGTISQLISGDSRSSAYLHKIAVVLGTTPAYLTGETDDPDEGAAPPPPEPAFQLVTLQVALPSQAALAAMFEAQLRVFADLSGAELAHELARRLPSGLARLRAAGPIEVTTEADEADEGDLALAEDHREARQARRR